MKKNISASVRAKLLNISRNEGKSFEAIVSLGYTTSRMKDFFDLNFLMVKEDHRSDILRKVIVNTFKHRKTDLFAMKEILNNEYKQDNQKQIQWNAFLRKNKLQAPSF